MELVKDIAIYVSIIAFLSGFLATVFTGSARIVKYTLAFLTVIFILVSILGFIASSGLMIFLYTQLIVLWIIVYFVNIAGAVAGYGFYVLLHKKKPGKKLNDADIVDYLLVDRFAEMESIAPERALARIKSGFYAGGRHDNNWYVHKSELSEQSQG